jgi:tRNA-specific 2-thiouridylase
VRKAKHSEKDQAYMLYKLSQEQLAATLMPLGELSKAEVRQIAKDAGLEVASKADSQEICFVTDGSYAVYIEKNASPEDLKEGYFVDTEGNVLGKHKGIIHYTVGQRKGLGIALGAPAYVKEIDPQSNRVVLCKNEELFTYELHADDFNWISGEAPEGEIECDACVRYRGVLKPAIAVALPDGRVRVRFKEPQRAVTRGQAAVLYRGDEVLGGGTII